MARKLFQSREAREKLRGMGGIMASSPELSQTVAKFSDGMMVEGPATTALRQVRGIQNTVSEMQARTAIMQEQLRRREAARQAAAADRFDLISSIQELDPNFNLTTIPALDRFGELGESIAAAQLPEQGPVVPVAPAGGARERTSEAARILIESGMSPDEVQRMIDQGVDLNYLLAQLPPGSVSGIDVERPDDIFPPSQAEAEVDRLAGRAMTTGTPLFEQSVELLPPGVEPPITEEVRPDRVNRAALLSQMEEEMRNRAAQEEGVVAEERQRAATAATMQSEAEADDRESGGARQRLQAAQLAAAKVVTGGGETGGGEAGAGDFDFDASFEQALERVGRVMGDAGAGDDEDSRKKAMANLAMIGLAIAAGQSPNALTNIAQGALTGMQAMQAQEAREADLAREARLTALEMAEKAADRASRERIAGMRTASEGEETRQEYLYNATFSATLTGLIGEGIPAEEAATRAAAIAAQAAPNAPSAGSATVPLSTMKAAEDQARALGQTEFTFGGQRYPVRPAS